MSEKFQDFLAFGVLSRDTWCNSSIVASSRRTAYPGRLAGLPLHHPSCVGFHVSLQKAAPSVLCVHAESNIRYTHGARTVVKPSANMICAARRIGNRPPLSGHRLD